MKKLTKIKLINWHLFSNQTIEVDGNTLVSGENGAGKSTFLDAIQFLLVGGKSGAKFNIAANELAKRTLEGYVRGKLGAQNKEFLRPGDVISHIALEFYDEISKSYNIIGAVLDLPKNSSLKDRLYILENCSITEEMYVENNKPRDYKNMRDYLKGIGIDFDYFETQKKYRDAVSKFFGIDALKYSKLLPKALAFKPVDLQSLVFDFLLDDNPIDVQSLKNNVSQLKKVEATIKLDKEKLETLEKIKEVGNELIQTENQIDINQLMNNLNWVEQRETFVQKSENEITNLDRKLEQLREKKKEVENKIIANEERILSLEKAKDSNDMSKAVDKIKQEKEALQKEYEHQNEVCANIKNILDEEVESFKQILKIVPDKSLSAFCDYYLKNKNSLIISDLESHLILASQAIDSYDKAYYVERQNIEKDKRELSEQLRKAKDQLNSLEQNEKPYPRNVIMLTNCINEELTQKYQTNINARPFADLIDIEDETWRDAVEGYLNTQRFDIIIEPKYFDEALEIYDRVKTEQKIYGVGLVNTTKLQEFEYLGENSLASKIKTDHPFARKYANMLLSQVVCCENVQDIKKYKRAVTKTGMTYGNYTARQINPSTWQVPFIGKKATETQIELAKENVKNLEEAMKVYYGQTDQNESISHLLQRSRTKQVLAQNQLGYFESAEEIRKNILALERKIESYSTDKKVQDLENELDKERMEKRDLRLESDSLVGEITSIKDKKSQTMQNLEQTKITLDKFMQEQKDFSQNHPEKLSLAQTQYYSLKQKCSHDYQRVNDYIIKNDTTLKNLLPKLENQVTNLMREYTYKHSFDAEPQRESLNLFIQEANVIKNQKLVQYELQAIELRKNSETSFKEEFVNKLRASIQSAQAQIEELNIALEGKTFGSDQYKIVAYPSKDKEFQMYYNLIMGSKDFEDQSLFTEGLNRKQEEILKELFEKIASDDPQYDKLSMQFLDYRQYMEYDIQITNQNGNISLFSNVAKEKSGGETQVPFYIVIAASFQQLLSHNKRADSGCVVLFDEAFNNMDESRIEAMMRFYNSLSIQLIISIPPQRVPNIIQYVNTSLVIVKHDDTSIIQSFRSKLDILV